MEALAASLGISIAMLVLVAIGVTLLFPVFWVWMLVDSLMRDTTGYPSGDIGEKVMWALLIAIMQPVALLYFFLVWMKARNDSAAGATVVTA